MRVVVFLVVLIPQLLWADTNCRFTFSTAIYVASGHSKSPMFDITKPETLHPLGQALRYELITLGKDPATDNIDALHAQIPQIIDWLQEAPDKVNAEEVNSYQGLTPYQLDPIIGGSSTRRVVRAQRVSELITFLRKAYQRRQFTYYDYFSTLHEASVLFKHRGLQDISGIQEWRQTILTKFTKLYEQRQAIILITFDRDPTHLDFIRSAGHFAFAALKTIESRPDFGVKRSPQEHLEHDVFAHGSNIFRDLLDIGPQSRDRVISLVDYYLNTIRPRLNQQDIPYGDAIMAHVLHDEVINHITESTRNDSIVALSEFLLDGRVSPFEFATHEMATQRYHYENYRRELVDEHPVVIDKLNAMGLFLSDAFVEEFSLPRDQRVSFKKGEVECDCPF